MLIILSPIIAIYQIDFFQGVEKANFCLYFMITLQQNSKDHLKSLNNLGSFQILFLELHKSFSITFNIYMHIYRNTEFMNSFAFLLLEQIAIFLSNIYMNGYSVLCYSYVSMYFFVRNTKLSFLFDLNISLICVQIHL